MLRDKNHWNKKKNQCVCDNKRDLLLLQIQKPVKNELECNWKCKIPNSPKKLEIVNLNGGGGGHFALKEVKPCLWKADIFILFFCRPSSSTGMPQSDTREELTALKALDKLLKTYDRRSTPTNDLGKSRIVFFLPC